MGFWQTGYYEFHQFDGLEGISFLAKPVTYVCNICQKEFELEADLRAHRFNHHPLRRPELRINGQEVGGTPLRITEALEADDIEISEIETIRLNGNLVHSINEVREFLSGQRHDVVTIGLSSQGVEAIYQLRFDIASESDLAGIDANFMEMARTHRLDMRAIESFIDRSKGNRTALSYCDGICEYLYGILAKERRANITMPYEQYRERFSRAADILKYYRQPLGRVIGAIVAFHFNQFGEAHHLSDSSRVGSVSRTFVSADTPVPPFSDLSFPPEAVGVVVDAQQCVA